MRGGARRRGASTGRHLVADHGVLVLRRKRGRARAAHARHGRAPARTVRDQRAHAGRGRRRRRRPGHAGRASQLPQPGPPRLCPAAAAALERAPLRRGHPLPTRRAHRPPQPQRRADRQGRPKATAPLHALPQGALVH